MSAVFFVTAQHTGRLDTKGKFTVVDKSNLELHEILTKGVSVFEEWPKRFEQFIAWRQNRFSSQTKSRTQAGLYKDFDTFYFGLYLNLPSACFDFMRTVFEKYVKEHWDGGYISLMRQHLTQKKYVGLAKAAGMLGMGQKWVNSLIDSGKLEAVVRAKVKRRVVLIERTSLERLKREFDELLGVRETAELLGVSRDAVNDLMQHGCILPLRGLSIDGFKNWKFSRESINGLLEQIEKKVVTQGATRTISFAIAFAKAKGSRSCSGLGGFVRMVLDGEIVPHAKSVGTGLYQFSFSEEQILEQRRAIRGNAYYMTEAARLLNTKKATVSFLIKKGMIPTGAAMTGRWKLSVNEEGIDTFTSTYTLVSKLAATIHTSPNLVIDALESCGVFPVSGMKIDGGHTYVFRNSDLEAVNLAEAVSKQRAKYQLRDTRWKVGIEQAATSLGIDASTVGR